MLNLGEATIRNCAGVTRRQMLQVGGRGGPSHLETFDPKPNTPDTVRGPYGTIRTKVTGIHIGELLPQVADLV